MNATWDDEFEKWRNEFLLSQSKDERFLTLSKEWFQRSVDLKYSYQFDWLGVPIIQMPGDLIVFQDIVWKTKPDLIIETGVARGGSLVFWASMLELCNPTGSVIGIDIDIRSHARKAISESQFGNRITLIEGGSTTEEVRKQVVDIAERAARIMVILDSNHTHDHVLGELELYAGLVTPGCYLLVLDTVIDDLNVDPARSWGPGRSPKSAVREFMSNRQGLFEPAGELEAKSTLTVAPNGYWKRTASA